MSSRSDVPVSAIRSRRTLTSDRRAVDFVNVARGRFVNLRCISTDSRTGPRSLLHDLQTEHGMVVPTDGKYRTRYLPKVAETQRFTAGNTYQGKMWGRIFAPFISNIDEGHSRLCYATKTWPYARRPAAGQRRGRSHIVESVWEERCLAVFVADSRRLPVVAT